MITADSIRKERDKPNPIYETKIDGVLIANTEALMEDKTIWLFPDELGIKGEYLVRSFTHRGFNVKWDCVTVGISL